MNDKEFMNGLRNMSSKRKMAVLWAVNYQQSLKEAGITDPYEVEYYKSAWKEADELEKKFGHRPVFAMPELDPEDIPDIYPKDFADQMTKKHKKGK